MTQRFLLLAVSCFFLFSCLGKGGPKEDRNENGSLPGTDQTTAEDGAMNEIPDTAASAEQSEIREEKELSTVSKMTEDSLVTLYLSPSDRGDNTAGKADMEKLVPSAISGKKPGAGDGLFWVRVEDPGNTQAWIIADESVWDLTGLPVYETEEDSGKTAVTPECFYNISVGSPSVGWFFRYLASQYTKPVDELQKIPGLINFQKQETYSKHDSMKENPFFDVAMAWDDLSLEGYLWENGNSGKTANVLYLKTVLLTLSSPDQNILGISKETTYDDLVKLFGEPSSIKDPQKPIWFLEMQALTFYLSGDLKVENIGIEIFWD